VRALIFVMFVIRHTATGLVCYGIIAHTLVSALMFVMFVVSHSVARVT